MVLSTSTMEDHRGIMANSDRCVTLPLDSLNNLPAEMAELYGMIRAMTRDWMRNLRQEIILFEARHVLARIQMVREDVEERGLTVEKQGLTEEEINLLPTRTFSSQGQEAGDTTRGGEQEIAQCQICLLDLEDGDTLRCIPCIHNFHKHCLDKWVKRHATCPLCRHDLRPQRHD